MTPPAQRAATSSARGQRKTAPDISVVLPVHNEEACLEQEITRIRDGLDASSYSWEMVLVDDASSDRSAEIADQFPWIRRITFKVNRGSGAARRVGSQAALGDVVVWTDADMTYPNDEIAKLVDELGDADQIVGARRTEEGTLRLLRAPTKWAIKKFASLLTKTDIPDLNTGFRAFRREAAAPYLPLLPNGFSHVTTITMTMLMDGKSVVYTPIDYATRTGRSKFHPIRDTYVYVMQVLRMVTFFSPLTVFMPVGLTLLTLGGLKLVYDIIQDPVRVAINTMLLLFAGFQIVALALLADLVVARTRHGADG
ncbi:MAG: glycosyltransferase family 2 protein [Acidimicrobiales bacterium]|nr:glycosyltransferase family 2 protein [Acidimicrobiales bacterium]